MKISMKQRGDGTRLFYININIMCGKKFAREILDLNVHRQRVKKKGTSNILKYSSRVRVYLYVYGFLNSKLTRRKGRKSRWGRGWRYLNPQ